MIRRNFLGSVVGLFAVTGLPLYAERPSKSFSELNKATNKEVMKSLSDDDSEICCIIKLTNGDLIKGPNTTKQWSENCVKFLSEDLIIMQEIEIDSMLLFDKKFGLIFNKPLPRMKLDNNYTLKLSFTINLSFT